MTQRKDETAMFGSLRGVADQLCKINVKGREAVNGHAETLQTFSELIQDVMNNIPKEQIVIYDSLLMRIYERIEEIDSCHLVDDQESEQKMEQECEEEALLYNALNIEIGNVMEKLAALNVEAFRMMKKVETSNVYKFKCFLDTDLNTLSRAIENAELCAGGVKLRIESAIQGSFE